MKKIFLSGALLLAFAAAVPGDAITQRQDFFRQVVKNPAAAEKFFNGQQRISLFIRRR